MSTRTWGLRLALGIAIAVGCSRGDATAPPVAAADSPASPSAAPAPAAEDRAPAAEPEPTRADPDSPPAGASPTTQAAPSEPEPARSEPTTAARPIDDAKGMTDVDLVDQHGPPDEKNGERWIYRYPREGGCVDREIVYTLRLKRRVVVEVKRSTRQTGKHCAPDGVP